MIKKVEKDNIHFLDYIGDEYYRCLYLYLNYTKYGFNNNNIKIWVQTNKNNNITALILMYYNGMHIFSKNLDCDFNELKELIYLENPAVICSEETIIMNLEKIIINYNSEYGWVRELDNIDEKYNLSCGCVAKEEDFMKIAKLLYEDDLGNSYKFEDLIDQIKVRNKEGYGRNYIIKDENKIVSHVGTGAENSKIAILNYVITDKNYRGRGLATKIVGKICYDLIKEGKKVYLINYSEESTALYNKIGFKICCKYGKLFKNLK